MSGTVPITPPVPPTRPNAPQFPATGARPASGVIVARSPAPVVRHQLPDVTGLYENIPSAAGQNAAILLQLNQAGKAIVGWFSAPPPFVADLAPTISRPGGENASRMPNGVLFGNWEDQVANGIPISWLPGNFDKVNPLDPEDAMAEFQQPDPTASRLRNGYLRVNSRRQDELFLEIDIKFDVAASGYDRFLRSKRSARFSRLDLDFLPGPLARLAEAESVTPVPSTYVDMIRARVAPIGDPPTDPPVRRLLEQWYGADKLTREIRRTQIAATLDDFSFGQATAEQQAAIGRRLRAHMASRYLTIGGKTESYLGWYREVLADELDTVVITASNPSPVKKRFDAVGISILGQFRYTVTFISKGANTTLIGKAGFYAFGAAIKKDEIAYAKAADGTIVFVDSLPKYTVVRNMFDTNKTGRRHFGFFGDLGIGLGVGGGVGGSSLLGEMTFFSDRDLGFDDFADATFTIACFRGPNASLGNYVSFDTFTAKVVELHLANGAVLTSDETSSFVFSPPKVPTLDDLKDPKKYVDKWTEAKLDGKIFDLSEGYGHFVAADGKSQPDLPPLPVPDKPLSFDPALSKRTIEVFFKVDSADLNVNTGGITARYSLEVLLATERALFDGADARAYAWGYASPEHTAAHNLTLSQARADAVAQAVRDAFGPSLRIKDVGATGLGEAPAENSGLHDPEQSQLTLADFTARYSSEVAQWPQWRRVDLAVEGILIASASE